MASGHRPGRGRRDDARLHVRGWGRVQHEQISDYSPDPRSFLYAIEGGLPVKDNRGRIAVEAHSGGSRVVWGSSFEPLDAATEAQLSEMWRSSLPVVLGNLKRLVEGAAT